MGTLAFRLAADEPWNEAFFRSLSAFTPSSMVPEAQTPGERTITAVLVLTALVFYLLAIGTAVQEVGRRLIDEDLQDRRERRTMERLKDHYIVCGYGNVGRAVVAALVAKGDRVAVIDNSPENLAEARRRRVDTVLGRASDDAVLERAGIATAAALVACVGSDAENLYILLAAKRARPGVRLVARASDSTNRESLKRAVPELDATSPYEAAGQELADLARAPAQAPSPSPAGASVGIEPRARVEHRSQPQLRGG
jgi:voltage-gated potassium channel